MFGIVKLCGCGDVSSDTGVVSITGSTATGRGTYAISSLSAFVNVSCEGPVATVVCAGEASTFGVGIRGPALIATIAPRPIEQGTASHTVLIMSTPAWPSMRTIVSLGLNRALKWRPGRNLMTCEKSFVLELTRGREATSLKADEIRASTRLQEQ